MTIVLKSNVFWGRRSGKVSMDVPKGQNRPWGFCIQQLQWASGANRNRKQTACALHNVNKKWFGGKR